MDRDYSSVKFEHMFEADVSPKLFSVIEDYSEKRFICLKYGWDYDDLVYAVEVNDDDFAKFLKREISLDKIFESSENYHPQYYECITMNWDHIILYKRGNIEYNKFYDGYYVSEWAEKDFKKHLSEKKDDYLKEIKNIDNIINKLN